MCFFVLIDLFDLSSVEGGYSEDQEEVLVLELEESR
jgi:hypothetical protein